MSRFFTKSFAKSHVLLFASFISVLSAACAPQLKGVSDGVSQSACTATDSQSSSLAESERKDPFEMYGKVILDSSGSSSDRYAESYQTANKTSRSGLDRISIGQELSVTLRENCQKEKHGEISDAIRSSQSNLNSSAHSTLSGLRSYNFKLNREMSFAELKSIADADACVFGIARETRAYASIETISKATAEQDPLSESQDHLRALETLRLTSVFAEMKERPSIIAVIDTGIDMAHEELSSVLWKNSDEIPENGKDDDANGYVDDIHGYNFAENKSSPQLTGDWFGNQHGTHVAGLAAARGGNQRGGQGVIPFNVKLMPLNVFGAEPGALSSVISDAIRYAADNGANVINLSIGGLGRNAVYESAIAYAIKKGAVIVAAAGNESQVLSEEYFLVPAAYGSSYRGLISVGSVDSETLALSGFSNFGVKFVEIAAPGSERSDISRGLLSAWPNNEYRRLQGTSMSAPLAAGSAAMAMSLLKVRGYSPSPATVEGLLVATAKKADDLKDKISEGRILNLRLLAEHISKYYPQGGSGDPGVRGIKDCDYANNL